MLVLDHGRVSQLGSPAELRKQPGLYRQIEQIQASEAEQVAGEPKEATVS